MINDTGQKNSALNVLSSGLFMTSTMLFANIWVNSDEYKENISKGYIDDLYALNDKYLQKLLDHKAKPVNQEEEKQIIEHEELLVKAEEILEAVE